MTNIRNILFAALAYAIAIPAFSMGAANGVPGGITLVPGTVVVPGVGGSAVTGTVPLPGTMGSQQGVGNLNPGLAPPPATNDSLYPQTYYPQTGLPGTIQSTLPPYAPQAPVLSGAGSGAVPNLYPNGVPSTVATCPSGATAWNGTC